MEIKKIIHKKVNKDGTFKDKSGAIVTDGVIRMSNGEGCGLPNCHCSDGHWLTIILPLKRGIVEGIQVKFQDGKEMSTFLNKHELYLNS